MVRQREVQRAVVVAAEELEARRRRLAEERAAARVIDLAAPACVRNTFVFLGAFSSASLAKLGGL